MKLSNLFVKTSKENPAGEVSVNAKLLTRAGFIFKEMAGVYTYLPLGLKVLNKIKQIVRTHLDAVAQETQMTILGPEENRKTTGRIDTVDVLMKTHGANELSKQKSTNEYVINYSHEEMATPIAKHFLKSYKDFPAAFYQFGIKFRNEARAKSGLLRGREFLMKDGYSFHTSQEDFQTYYDQMKQVYMNVYKELGLGDDTFETMASGGDFTEKYSHEFQTVCESGEDLIFLDEKSGLCYNLEVAPSKVPPLSYTQDLLPMEDIYGEDVVSVAKLCEFLNLPVESTVKTMLYKGNNDQLYAVVVRGDYEVNELKLTKALGIKRVTLLTDEQILKETGAERGYAGVVNLPEQFQLVCDDALEQMTNFESGTNKTHYHTININRGRDLPKPERFYDIKEAKEGDLCPSTDDVYIVHKASEVGNIFPLETKYSDAFDFTYSDKDNSLKKVVMGCYGIGVSRVMGIVVEKFHDEKGIVWPENVAPFTHVVLGIGDRGLEEAHNLYTQLKEKGVDVCFDDRDLGPGAKFKDADLIGYPYQIVVGNKTLKDGMFCEYIERKTGEKNLLEISSVVADIGENYGR